MRLSDTAMNVYRDIEETGNTLHNEYIGSNWCKTCVFGAKSYDDGGVQYTCNQTNPLMCPPTYETLDLVVHYLEVALKEKDFD
jgi:hypothetical protein